MWLSTGRRDWQLSQLLDDDGDRHACVADSCSVIVQVERISVFNGKAGAGFFLVPVGVFLAPVRGLLSSSCVAPPPPPRCGAEQGTKKSNIPFHGCLGSLQVWEEAKKAFVPGQVVFFRILEGLWQDSCTSRKDPISHAPGFFWGLGGLAQDTVRPVQGLHKASARTFAVCSRVRAHPFSSRC